MSYENIPKKTGLAQLIRSLPRDKLRNPTANTRKRDLDGGFFCFWKKTHPFEDCGFNSP